MDQSQYNISYYFWAWVCSAPDYIHFLLSFVHRRRLMEKERESMICPFQERARWRRFVCSRRRRTTLTSVTSAGPRRLKRTAPSGQQEQHRRSRPTNEILPFLLLFSRETHLGKGGQKLLSPCCSLSSLYFPFNPHVISHPLFSIPHPPPRFNSTETNWFRDCIFFLFCFLIASWWFLILYKTLLTSMFIYARNYRIWAQNNPKNLLKINSKIQGKSRKIQEKFKKIQKKIHENS